MALGTAVDVKPEKSFHHDLVRPTQITVPWVKIIDNEGIDVLDGASPIENPDTEITNSTTHILNVGKAGTLLRLRLKYDDAITTFTTSPAFEVFGRTSTVDSDGAVTAGQWQRLVNLCGNTIVTINHDKAGSGESSQTDVTDGTDMYTHPHPADHTFDMDGCDEILVGVAVVINPAAGDKNLVSLWAKVI